ncbi:MAG: GAF and ANTAR domain-containing protein [Janthinobacterium lividum]
MDLLATRLGDVARLLQASTDTGAMLQEVVASAVQLIPGAQEASISVVTGRRHVTSEHYSSELPRLVDTMQTEVGQGPCVDAAFRQRTVRVPDMSAERRWPEFARKAHDLGVGSMLAFQLFVVGDNLGALNLFSRAPDAFGDASEQIGLLFASLAAVALAEARKDDQLAEAVDTRDLIGQAKGLLMERYSIDAEQAFTVLWRISQTSQRKLHDLADELTSTRRLAELDPRD